MGPLQAMWSKWLGDQWTIGDWQGMLAVGAEELPAWMPAANEGMRVKATEPAAEQSQSFDDPPQSFKEYDPEWARAFSTGTAAASCDHAQMLAGVRVPVLFTHHFRKVDEKTGTVMGAISDQQVARARELVTNVGQPFEVLSYPQMARMMHSQDPQLFTKNIVAWSATLSE